MAIFYVISALGCAFAWNWPALIFFRFIGGLGIGGSSVLGPMYIAEIAPPKWRGRLVGSFQVNIVVGILLAYLSNFLIARMQLGAAEWRWQLGISAIPAFCFLIALFGIPRSPRWLAMQSNLKEALQVLRLTGVEHPQQELDEIVASIHLERSSPTDPLFSRQYRFPVFLAITVGMFCQLSGINAILYYLNDIFAMAGASKISGDLQAVAVGATNLVATLLAMTVIDRFGRKKLLLVGTVGLTICLSAISYVFVTHRHLHWLVWLLMAYIACFAASQGAVVWVYISEVFPNRVRAKGQGLGKLVPLDFKCHHLAHISHHGGNIRRLSIHLFCRDDGARLLPGSVLLPGNNRHIAREDGAQARYRLSGSASGMRNRLTRCWSFYRRSRRLLDYASRHLLAIDRVRSFRSPASSPVWQRAVMFFQDGFDDRPCRLH